MRFPYAHLPLHDSTGASQWELGYGGYGGSSLNLQTLVVPHPFRKARCERSRKGLSRGEAAVDI